MPDVHTWSLSDSLREKELTGIKTWGEIYIDFKSECKVSVISSSCVESRTVNNLRSLLLDVELDSDVQISVLGGSL